MISKGFTIISRSEPHFQDIDGALPWKSVIQKVRNRLPNTDPNETAEEWLEQLKWRSNSVRFETCWHKHDDHTPAYIRAIPDHCLRPMVNPEFFKNVIADGRMSF